VLEGKADLGLRARRPRVWWATVTGGDIRGTGDRTRCAWLKHPTHTPASSLNGVKVRTRCEGEHGSRRGRWAWRRRRRACV
jgi:hypothetical protein